MTATDDQAAALRAQLDGDYDEHRRLRAGLDARGAMGGYTALVTAAFIEAVDRRFGPWHRDDATVAAFISGVRSRFPGAEDEIDQATAERVVRKALGRGSVSDIDGPAIRRTEMLLLPVMVAGEQYSGEDLDRFLADARSFSTAEPAAARPPGGWLYLRHGSAARPSGDRCLAEKGARELAVQLFISYRSRVCRGRR